MRLQFAGPASQPPGEAHRRPRFSGPAFHPRGLGRALTALLGLAAWAAGVTGTLPACAATKTWTGAAPDAYWTNAANWSPAGAPANGDALVFPGGTPQVISTNRGGALSSVASLTFAGTNFSLLSLTPLTLTGGLTHQPSGDVTNFLRIGLTLGVDQTWSLGNGLFMVQSNVAIGARTLTVEDGSADLEFRVGPTGTGNLVKSGSGTMAFLAPTPFSGTLTAHGGVVVVNDDFAGNIVADTAATVGTTNSGSSVDGLILNFGGTLSPGLTGRNIFTSSNSVFFQQGATFRVDLAANGTPGFGHDQLVVLGGVTLNGGTLSLQTTGSGAGGTSYRIIDNDGTDPVNSIFRSLPEGSVVTNGAQTFQITYRGGDGNDVVLRKVPIVPGGVRHWTGAGVGGGWSNAANWSNNLAPAFGDILIFPAGVAKVITTNDFIDERAFGGLRFLGTNYQVHGQRFALGGTGLLFTNTSGTNTLFADVTLVGPQTWDIPGSSRTLQMFGEILGSTDADVFKAGAGTLVLTNNPLWLGSITSSNGPVVFNGDNGRLTVIAGGPIRGLGPTGPLTATNNTAGVEPGTSRLRVNGNLTLGGGANFSVTLSGAIEGANYGTVSVTGAVDIAGADLFVTPTFAPALGTEFVVIRNDGVDPVTGAGFVGKPEGAIFAAGGRSFAISYHGGDGNDVSITTVTAPSGVTRVWDGGAGANDSWTNRFNWDLDASVLAGDSLVFTRSTPDSAQNNFPAGTAFGAISFTAQNGFASFSLTGNAFALLAGLTSSVPGTAQIFNAVEFQAAQTIGGEGSGPLNLFGALSGDVGAVITLDRRGGAAFGGATANTYVGETRVRRGTLALNKADGVAAVAGPVVIGGQGLSATLRVASSGQLTAGRPVTLLDSLANLTIQDRVTNTMGLLTVRAGDVDLDVSRLNVSGLVAGAGARLIVAADGENFGTLNVAGGVSLGGCALVVRTGTNVLGLGTVLRLIENDGADPVGGTFLNVPPGGRLTNDVHVFEVNYAAAPGNNDVTATVVGYVAGGTRVWTGAGANGLWSNRTNWQSNLVPLPGDALFFPATAARTVSTNDFPANLAFFSLEFGNTNHLVYGSPIRSLGGIRATNTDLNTSFIGLFLPITLASDQAFVSGFPNLRFLNTVSLGGRELTLQGSTPKQFFGAIAGVGSIIAEGPASLRGDNTFLGLVRVSSGATLEIGSDLALGSPLVGTVVEPGGELSFGATPVSSAEPLTLGGALSVLASGHVHSGPIVLSHGLVEVHAELAGAGGLTLTGPVSGPGRWWIRPRINLTLRGTNTYSGETFVDGGVLTVDGPQPASAVRVVNGGLRGSGIVGPLRMDDGQIHPGSSPGTGLLTVEGDADIAAGARMTFNLGGTAAGTQHDRLAVNGRVSLNGALLDLNLDYVPRLGDGFVLIANDGTDPVIGTFAGLSEGAILNVGQVQFRISYQGGTGNDVVVTNLTLLPSGQTAVWEGDAGSGNWALVANWLNGRRPAEGDDVVFPGNVVTTRRDTTNTFAGLAVNQIFIGGGDWNFNGNGLRLIGGLVVTNRTSGLMPLLNVPVELTKNQAWVMVTNSLRVTAPVDLGTNELVLHVTGGEFDLSGAVHGNGFLIKRGPGMLTLSGSNDFTGGPRIEAGTVRLLRDHLAGFAWRLLGGRLILGGGIPGLFASAGSFSVGGGLDEVPINGSLTLGPGATLDLEDRAARLRVQGQVVLNNPILANIPTGFTLTSFGAEERIIIENDGPGPIVGIFAGMPEGTLVPTGAPGITNRLTYVGGDGNDLAIQRLPPEPTHITRIWDGGGTNASWLNPSNWVADFLPEAGDDLLFPAAAARKTNHLNGVGSLNLVFANSLQFDGGGYLITNHITGSPFDFNFGILQLTEGIRSLQASGTNTLRVPLALGADQEWHVASSNATLRLVGGLLGEATARKTGPGRLEITNAAATNGTRFVNVAGPTTIRDTSFGPLAVGDGLLEIVNSSAASLIVTGGVARLTNASVANLIASHGELQVASVPLNFTQANLATNVGLFTGSRLVVDFATSNATALTVRGPVRILDASLDVRVHYPTRPGDQLAVIGPFTPAIVVPFPPIFGNPSNAFPTSVTGTFNGLPDGAVTNFSGRPYRVQYSMDLGQFGTFPGVFLTALPIELQFTNVTRLVNGQVRLQGVAEPNTNVIFEATEDFLQYTVIGNTLANVSGQFQFTDTSATALSQRFYRARYP